MGKIREAYTNSLGDLQDPIYGGIVPYKARGNSLKHRPEK
jgi:hypothetical protein